MTPKPILCGKCGTSDKFHIRDTWRSKVIVRCQKCEHKAKSDSLPAALAKFEEKPK